MGRVKGIEEILYVFTLLSVIKGYRYQDKTENA